MTNTHLLTHRISKIHSRLTNLYQHASVSLSPDLLPKALIELGVVSEVLQQMMKEITEQNDLLQSIQAHIEAERYRAQYLADLMSNGYLVINAQMQIQAVNPAATTLLNSTKKDLIGQSLLILLSEEDREILRHKLSQLKQGERTEFSLRFRKSSSSFLQVAMIVERNWDCQTKASCFYLFLKDAMERSHPSANALSNGPFGNYPTQLYCKGDVISLSHQQVWIVVQGTVKLTTLTEQGEELLIGLLGPSMVFGSSLTALQIYQAVALTDTQLISVSMAELFQSPVLIQAVLPLLTQRLQQTEKFLSVYGQMRIEDRLEHLLELLKQEVGEAVEGGTRLRIRWTHQDLASACGTTRVTITRMLGKLQQQGRVAIDAKNHLILPHRR